MSKPLAIGVDLGGTKIATALVDETGAALASRQALTEASRGHAFVIQRIADEINAIAGDAKDEIAGIGIGSPGLVNPQAGTVTGAVNLGWDHVELAAGVRKLLRKDRPVYVAKDTNASALGERQFGAGRGHDDLVYLSIGTGFGAGVIAAGQLVVGAKCASADLGHLSLDPNGRQCACGGRGCVETVLSGNGLLATVRELIAKGSGPTRLTHQSDSGAVLAAARDDDAIALAAFEMQGRWLGQVFGICMMFTDPGVIILGGGLGSAAADLILPTAIEETNHYASPAQPRPRFEKSAVSSPAVGAASIVFSSL